MLSAKTSVYIGFSWLFQLILLDYQDELSPWAWQVEPSFSRWQQHSGDSASSSLVLRGKWGEWDESWCVYGSCHEAAVRKTSREIDQTSRNPSDFGSKNHSKYMKRKHAKATARFINPAFGHCFTCPNVGLLLLKHPISGPKVRSPIGQCTCSQPDLCKMLDDPAPSGGGSLSWLKT